MIEQDFRTLLASADTVGVYGVVNDDDTPVVTVSSLCGNRIYPLVLPTDSILPAITFSFIGGTSHPTFDTPGTQRYRVEVNCWGDTYDAAVTLRAAVTTALNGYATSKLSIQFMQPTDFFDHDLLQYRAMVEFYLYTSFQ